MKKYDVIILGAGPAGLTAGIYLSRARQSVLILDKGTVGGQVILTHAVANYPGLPELSGYKLASEMKKQAVEFGCDVLGNVSLKDFDFKGEEKIVITDSQEFRSRAVILAVGGKPRKLGLESEEKFKGRGVSACATCDGFFYRNQKVAVIGGGNTAVEEALYLANIAKEVILVHRRDELRSEKILRDQILEKSRSGNITLMWDNVLDEVLGDDSGVTGMRIKNVKTGEKQEIDLHGVFIAIGHKPNTGIFEGKLDMSGGYITVNGGSDGNATQSSLEGVYAAGDVMDHVYRQAITSAGSGCMAALDAEKYLDKLAAENNT